MHLEYQKATRRAPRAPKKPPRSSLGVLKRLPRGSLEVLWELLEVQKAPQATILDTFIGFRASKNPPGGPQVTIYRPCRRFRASRRGTAELEFRLSRVRSDPRTRSRTRFLHLYYWKTRSKRRCSLLTGGSADYDHSYQYHYHVFLLFSLLFLLVNAPGGG